jgi:hypothetical protein
MTTGGITVTCAVALLLQAPAVSVREIVVCAPFPAVKVIEDVPWPLLIVPLVMDQANVADGFAATDALPPVPAVIEVGAVMTGAASVSTMMFAELLFEQPFAVALTMRLTPAELDGMSNVMLLVPWPLVTVAPLTDHE